MSALIVIRTEVYNNKMRYFLEEMSNWNIHIAKIYRYDEVTEIFFGLTLMGYAEPSALYKDVKKYVTDLWFCPVGDGDTKVGADTEGMNWQSCKLEVS